MSTPLWAPSSSRVAASHLTRFMAGLARETGQSFSSYADLHAWSVSHAPEFWGHFWDYSGIAGEKGERLAVSLTRMPGARFLPDATLNFTENVLRGPDERVAIVAATERRALTRMTMGALRREVARMSAALLASGVRPGDRVCGIVANVPEAIIAALGAAAIGAIWSSCSPDFGVDGIVDRFGQVDPSVLVAVDGYDYGGRRFDCCDKIEAVAARLPSLSAVVVVPLAGTGVPAAGRVTPVLWDRWLDRSDAPAAGYGNFGFHQPLYILYSSGTTGVPKCIVHGAGGTLIEHLKEHQIHADVHPGDRVFYFTTCGWMMWNWLISALASGAALVLYDGAPFHPDGHRLFALAEEAGVTHFGVSARFIDAIAKAGLVPREHHDLASVRAILSTGSPLAPESFDFVYRAIKGDVHLSSVSGGTDIVGCFVGGNPNAPVWRGEIQAPGLGMDVRVFDDRGRAIEGTPGELVCGTPFPSMPTGFWNDSDGARYRQAYFERFPGVWCHGDWVASTEHGGFIIYGRSDATLNPGGVRIGTAEIYRQVEQIPDVLESVAIGQRWAGTERIVLFVRLAPDQELDEELRARIADRLRTHASPRHVPARIVQVADVPRTRSGKIVELAIRRTVHGEPVPNLDAIANPEALDGYRDRPELAS